MTNSISEIRATDFIFAIGTNTTETHPIISLEVKKALRNGAKLAVADPRKTEIAELAHTHIPHPAGSDLILLNAMANVIISENIYDQKFIRERTENFAELKETVQKYTPEYAEKAIGISADAIREVARGYANADKAMILYTMGVTQHICGTDNVLAIANLAMLCGHIGKPSTGVNPLRGQNNVQGACDMGGLPNVYPGYQKVVDENIREKFAKAWGVSLNPDNGLTVGEIMDFAYEGKVKGIYIMGENPVLSDANVNHVEEAFKKLDFLVVQDIFLTETAQLADVVLPAASFAEKDGTFTNSERRVQRIRKAIVPVGNCKNDWEIISMVATAMGYPMSYDSAEDIMREIAAVTPSYGGITYPRIDGDGLQWPCPTEEHPGTPYLHKGKFAKGLGTFQAVEFVPPNEETDSLYPFVLTTGRRLWHYHTGTMSRRAEGLEWKYPQEKLEINPEDVAKLRLREGEKVRVSSRRGEIEIAIHCTERVRPGTVFGSFHFRESAINKLTNPARDPKAKIPELKVCAVKIEKLA